MTQMVQVELKCGTTHTVTWVPVELKPKAGMTLVCKNDSRQWEVVEAYTRTPQESADINLGWRIGGL